MKGTFFAKPLQFTLQVNGEQWKQADKVEGVLEVTNHGSQDQSLRGLGITMAFGENKKIKTKDNSAFDTIESKLFIDNEIVSPGETKKLPWIFQLDDNAPITESKGSMYLICGDPKLPFATGQLQLKIEPTQIIDNFLKNITLFFKFKVKSLKNKKDALEAKLVPPASKELGMIDTLTLIIKISGDNLDLKYDFKTKKLSYNDSVMSIKAHKFNFRQSLTPKQYKIYGDSPNQEGMKQAIDEIINQVKKTNII